MGSKWCVAIILLVYVRFTSSASSIDFDSFVRNHSFVFISGWPQSGTSLVHQIFTLNNAMSTMVEKCEEKLGKRCVNWNHEGQWLLPGNTRTILNSGVMCPPPGNLSATERTSILSEWFQYWDQETVYLVEKSPHSFLKIPLLRELFGSAISLRFVVLLKHPVTLNIATPKGYTWTHHSEKATAPTSIRIDQHQYVNVKDNQKPLSLSQKYQVAQFFVDLMQHDNSTLYDHRHPQCSMGWIPAMHAFHQQLLADPRSINDVRIVRFESFQYPLGVCQALFQFVLYLPMLTVEAQATHNATIDELCSQHFGAARNPNSAVASSSSLPQSKAAQKLSRASKPLLLPGQTGRSSRTRKDITAPMQLPGHKALSPVPASAADGKHSRASSRVNNKVGALRLGAPVNRGPEEQRRRLAQSARNGTQFSVKQDIATPADHRALRLRSSAESAASFSFIPELVSERGRKRVREFVTAFDSLGPSMKGKLDLVSKQLKPFGYSLYQWQSRNIEESLFERWELKT